MNNLYAKTIHYFYSFRFFSILLAILFFLATGIFGYRFIIAHRHEKMYREASLAYEQFVRNLDNPKSSVDQEAHLFFAQYPNTPYAQLIRLYLSQKAVRENKMPEALDYCMQVIDQSKDVDLQAIVRKRAAHILLSMGQTQKALDLIRYEVPSSYVSSYEELRGDIFAALKNKDAAIKAYKKAKEAAYLENLQPLLQMKLDNLGSVPEALPEVSSI